MFQCLALCVLFVGYDAVIHTGCVLGCESISYSVTVSLEAQQRVAGAHVVPRALASLPEPQHCPDAPVIGYCGCSTCAEPAR